MAAYKNQPQQATSSEAITNNVRVEVESQYAAEKSQPFQGEWYFHYTVRITNEGDDTVQLLSRHWIITDATGRTEEIKGPGVVGEQPVLAPGETFQYTSGCGIKTSTGIMRGTYQMVSEDGGHFDVEIAPFAFPRTVHGSLEPIRSQVESTRINRQRTHEPIAASTHPSASRI